MLFLETVDRDDAPRAIIFQVVYPYQISDIAWKAICQMDDRLHAWAGRGQLPNAVSYMRGKIIVEEKVQAASLSSNSTASLTWRCVMLKMRATMPVSCASAI